MMMMFVWVVAVSCRSAYIGRPIYQGIIERMWMDVEGISL